jgi:5,10-methylenetetrahydromethanopterin reductase
LSDPDLPRLSFRLSGRVDPRRCIELARAADDAGLHTVWFAENPFERGVLPALAGCALATGRIGLGIGVFNPYNRHPTLMAMEAAALDELAGGRVVLGIGSGVMLIRPLAVPTDRPIAAMRDSVAIVRSMLAGEEARHAGRVFSADGARLGFRAPRPDLPIYLAAMGDQGIRLCGEVADGLLVSNMSPPAYTRRAVGLLRAAAERAGRPAPAVVQYAPCAVDADGAAARRAVTTAVGTLLPLYWRLGDGWPAIRAALRDYSGIDPAEFEKAVARLDQGEAPERVLDDRFVRAYAVAGTVDDCLEQCAELRRAGVTELALSPVGLDPVPALRALGRAAARAC